MPLPKMVFSVCVMGTHLAPIVTKIALPCRPIHIFGADKPVVRNDDTMEMCWLLKMEAARLHRGAVCAQYNYLGV